MAIHKYLAFVRVAEMGSITKAAEAMGYTQSAVSRMVADLEDEWNLNLLRRSRGGLALSSDRLMLLPYIKRSVQPLRGFAGAGKFAQGFGDRFYSHRLVLELSTQCLPSILKKTLSSYPRIVFQLRNIGIQRNRRGAVRRRDRLRLHKRTVFSGA